MTRNIKTVEKEIQENQKRFSDLKKEKNTEMREILDQYLELEEEKKKLEEGDWNVFWMSKMWEKDVS